MMLNVRASVLCVFAMACGGSAPPAPSAPQPAAAALPDKASIPHAAPEELGYAAIVAAPSRSEEDRALDPGRKPAELLSFLSVRRGMRVAEIAAGRGYTTELLARAVGPEGRVYGINSTFILDRFAQEPWTERLEKPEMNNVTRLDREFDHPFPANLRNLDLVVNVLFYHDTYWMGLDRAAMNRAIYETLAPGGRYVVIDHAAADENSEADVKTLHRVGERLVRDEIERAGFTLLETSEFLRNSEDAHDWNASPSAAGEQRGKSDRFALKFVKPVRTDP